MSFGKIRFLQNMLRLFLHRGDLWHRDQKFDWTNHKSLENSINMDKKTMSKKVFSVRGSVLPGKTPQSETTEFYLKSVLGKSSISRTRVIWGSWKLFLTWFWSIRSQILKEISIALLSLRISRAICSPQHDMFSDKSNATQVTAKTVVLNTLKLDFNTCTGQET